MRALTTRRELAGLFTAEAWPTAQAWLADATAQAAARPAALDVLFASAARACGRDPLSELWRTDTSARVLLLTGPAVWEPEAARRLYQHGTADERRAVLLALDVAEAPDPSLLALTRDALRTHDTRLISTALGPFAARHLAAAEFRQAVLKCVFCGVPLDEIAGLDGLDGRTGPDRSGEPPTTPDRADAELARMLAGFARERVAAGRAVPDGVWPVLRRFPAVVAGSGLPDEPSAADPIRAAAARQALDSHHRREKR